MELNVEKAIFKNIIVFNMKITMEISFLICEYMYQFSHIYKTTVSLHKLYGLRVNLSTTYVPLTCIKNYWMLFYKRLTIICFPLKNGFWLSNAVMQLGNIDIMTAEKCFCRLNNRNSLIRWISNYRRYILIKEIQ